MSTQVAGVARPASDSSTPPGPATTASIARGEGKQVNTVSEASQSSLIELARKILANVTETDKSATHIFPFEYV